MLTDAFIAAHVPAADPYMGGADRRGARVVVTVAADVIAAIRDAYAAAHGNRHVYGPGGVGGATFRAIVAAVVADFNTAADHYAQYCADCAFADGGY